MKTYFWAIALGLATVISSCKKDDKENEEAVTNLSTQAEDNNDSKSESDQTNSDIDKILESFPTINGRQATDTLKNVVCGCAVDKSQLANKTLILKFDGVTSCLSPSRLRSGTITITLINGEHWSDAGARLKVVFSNYKVIRQRDNKFWNFNGTKYLTNVNQRNWPAILLGSDSVLVKERANGIKVDVEGGSLVYNVARATTWKYVKSQTTANYIQLSALGDTIINGVNNIDTWGTNRFGKAFTNHYLSRWVSNTYCEIWRPVQGEIVHESNGNKLTIKLGVGTDGNPHTGDCAYGWKLSWLLSNGALGEKVFSY